MANDRKDRFSGPAPSQNRPGTPDRAHDRPAKPANADPAAGAKSPLEDTDWRDQSQGPSHPLDDSGRKKG